MMQRRDEMKLTPKAKETARAIVAAWNEDKLTQMFTVIEILGDDGVIAAVAISNVGTLNFDALFRSSLLELMRLGLLQMDQKKDSWEVLLLQELREAVKNDFVQFRDVPLTVNGAVGTIIYGSLTVGDGAVFSSSGYGDVTVTMQTLPDELVKLLGSDARNPNIEAAIQALKTADEPTRLEKAGKVIEELGRVLAHLSNTNGALAAITMMARMFTGGGL